jgi:hypothetical protein
VARALALWLGVVTTASSVACAPTHDYVIKNVTNQVTLKDSAHRDFEYVSVKADHGKLRVYGKLIDRPGCGSGGHVDLAILRPSGETAYATTLPLRRQSHRVRGWAGAAFRAALPYEVGASEEVRLALHDGECASDVPFECADNHAVPFSDAH